MTVMHVSISLLVIMNRLRLYHLILPITATYLLKTIPVEEKGRRQAVTLFPYLFALGQKKLLLIENDYIYEVDKNTFTLRRRIFAHWRMHGKAKNSQYSKPILRM